MWSRNWFCQRGPAEYSANPRSEVAASFEPRARPNFRRDIDSELKSAGEFQVDFVVVAQIEIEVLLVVVDGDRSGQ